jgi:NAD(P)-dependent dehydrogenase (short-subunit alcohol dehydrogenase family)
MNTLITGGSRGIGLGIALALAKEHHRIAINGLRPEADVADVLEQLRGAGAPEAIYCRGDIGSAEARTAMLDEIDARFGGLNLLVNNAGVAPKERLDLLEASEESFDHVLATNLKGPYFLSQAAANRMIARKADAPDERFAIINIGSISATVASVNRGEYCIAKAGTAMMTSLFAARLGEYDIPVYELRPGVTRTDMTAGVTEKYDQLIADGLCVTRRWGRPEDTGRAAAALARGDFPYSTGQAIHIDGGLTLPRL